MWKLRAQPVDQQHVHGWMRGLNSRIAITLLLVGGAVGCQNNPFAQNPLVLQSQVRQLQEQQTQVARQGEELQRRASSLERTNEQLEQMLAKSQQRELLLEDRLALLQDRLQTTASELADVRQEKEATAERVETLVSSMRRRGGATIRANSNLDRALPTFNDPSITVRRDGDVVRIEIPTERLFYQGGQQLTPEALQAIDSVAGEIQRLYPQQMFGVEAHASAQPGAGFRETPHRLLTQQALVVYDYLVGRGRIPPQQLFLASHGTNQPLFSNGDAAGRQRNARIEIVVYPETRS